jgi:hypothetical protein
MLGKGIFGRCHDPGGLFIQTVNDSWPDNPVNLREILAVKEEGMYKGARVDARARMHNHSRGFIDHDNPWILVENIQGDIFGDDVQCPRWGDMPGDHISPAQSHGRF